MAAIRVSVNGHDLGSRELAGSIVIGRGGECDLRLPDGDVSRAHCRIERSGSDYVLIDLGSRNGTLLDGARVSRRRLRNGDVLRVGNCTLRFESPSPSRRTLDDEVLEMLTNVAPSPMEELEAVGAAIRGPEAAVEAEPAVASHSTPPLAMIERPAVARVPRSLWDAATSGSAATSAQMDGTSARNQVVMQRPSAHRRQTPARQPSTQGPWFRRRIPLPAAVAAALVATVIVYLLAWGLPTTSSRFDPHKPLQHARHSRSAD